MGHKVEEKKTWNSLESNQSNQLVVELLNTEVGHSNLALSVIADWSNYDIFIEIIDHKLQFSVNLPQTGDMVETIALGKSFQSSKVLNWQNIDWIMF